MSVDDASPVVIPNEIPRVVFTSDQYNGAIGSYDRSCRSGLEVIYAAKRRDHSLLLIIGGPPAKVVP